MVYQTNLEANSSLGKSVEYSSQYDPSKLFAISRKPKRQEIGLNTTSLPFYGVDLWNHYEVSWLNEKNKPMVALAEISYSSDSPCIIESKSMKLYFNTLNNSVFTDKSALETLIKKDLELQVGSPVWVKLSLLHQASNHAKILEFSGETLDELDISCSLESIDSTFLKTDNEETTELLQSNLLKSNCLITHQPDWASIQIHYSGKKIQREGLLRYLVSFRNHNEFHEQCIERIFMDILTGCKPTELTIYARYTRRGGVDINPYRSTKPVDPRTIPNLRLIRQ